MDVITATVDARGQSCPGPLVALHKALKDADQGDLLEAPRDRPGLQVRRPVLVEALGSRAARCERDLGVYRYVIRKV